MGTSTNHPGLISTTSATLHAASSFLEGHYSRSMTGSEHERLPRRRGQSTARRAASRVWPAHNAPVRSRICLRFATQSAFPADVVVLDVRGACQRPGERGAPEAPPSADRRGDRRLLSRSRSDARSDARRRERVRDRAGDARASLKAAIDRVVARRGRCHDPGQVFAFVGGKGGVGTTTLAVNVAAVLADRRASSTLLIDLHVAYGDAALFLGVEPRFSVADALENVHRLDEAFLRSLVGRTKIGLDVLASSDRAMVGPRGRPRGAPPDRLRRPPLPACGARRAAVGRHDARRVGAGHTASSSSPTRSWRRCAAPAGWRRRSASATAKDRVAVVVSRYDQRRRNRTEGNRARDGRPGRGGVSRATIAWRSAR